MTGGILIILNYNFCLIYHYYRLATQNSPRTCSLHWLRSNHTYITPSIVLYRPKFIHNRTFVYDKIIIIMIN